MHALSLFPLGLSLAVTVPTLALHLPGEKASGEAVVDPNQTGKREWSAMWFHGARPTKPGGRGCATAEDRPSLPSGFLIHLSPSQGSVVATAGTCTKAARLARRVCR